MQELRGLLRMVFDTENDATLAITGRWHGRDGVGGVQRGRARGEGRGLRPRLLRRSPAPDHGAGRRRGDRGRVAPGHAQRRPPTSRLRSTRSVTRRSSASCTGRPLPAFAKTSPEIAKLAHERRRRRSSPTPWLRSERSRVRHRRAGERTSSTPGAQKCISAVPGLSRRSPSATRAMEKINATARPRASSWYLDITAQPHLLGHAAQVPPHRPDQPRLRALRGTAHHRRRGPRQPHRPREADRGGDVGRLRGDGRCRCWSPSREPPSHADHGAECPTASTKPRSAPT